MKKLIYYLILFSCMNLFSQEQISLGVYQDLRLLLTGDDHNNDAGTIDIVMRIEMQGKQQNWGYLTIFPQFEYAEIAGNYKRWSANVGYTFNEIFVEIMPYVSYGWIDRGVSFRSIGAGCEISYKIGKLEISLLNEFVERQELNKWVCSIYGGIKYNIKLK